MTKINKKILIVEDDEDFSFILEKRLTIEGFFVVIAKDGEDGVLVSEKEKPDLIFSDMLMPKMDGMAMAKKIRETNTKVPIIFLTNIKDVSYTENIKKSDNFEYMIKSDTRINEIVEKAKSKLEAS